MLVTLMSSYCMHVKEWKCKPDENVGASSTNVGNIQSLEHKFPINHLCYTTKRCHCNSLLSFRKPNSNWGDFATSQKIDWDRRSIQFQSRNYYCSDIMRYPRDWKDMENWCSTDVSLSLPSFLEPWIWTWQITKVECQDSRSRSSSAAGYRFHQRQITTNLENLGALNR